MNAEYTRVRLEPDYFLRAKQLRPELLENLRREGKSGAFWGLPEGW